MFFNIRFHILSIYISTLYCLLLNAENIQFINYSKESVHFSATLINNAIQIILFFRHNRCDFWRNPIAGTAVRRTPLCQIQYSTVNRAGMDYTKLGKFLPQ